MSGNRVIQRFTTARIPGAMIQASRNRCEGPAGELALQPSPPYSVLSAPPPRTRSAVTVTSAF